MALNKEKIARLYRKRVGVVRLRRERLRKDIVTYPFEFRETHPNIGCAHLDIAARADRQDIINLADQCLYLAKNNGRNRIWC